MCRRQHSCFNSQPPEGGWTSRFPLMRRPSMFQLTAARRRLAALVPALYAKNPVSTHSRPKAAGGGGASAETQALQFQLTAARRRLALSYALLGGAGDVSTHSRPKAAGFRYHVQDAFYSVSTHSRPKAAGRPGHHLGARIMFQLTAARRRLAAYTLVAPLLQEVSTHSRPKAAGEYNDAPALHKMVSTHSRPKAAGIMGVKRFSGQIVSTHSRPKAAG